MKGLLFGTAGVPVSSKERSTEGGIKRVRELNLDCMEVQFVRGVKMGRETAERVREVSEKDNIALSVHAPYYINLNAGERDKKEASVKRILDSAKISSLFGGKSVVFHAGFYQRGDRKKVYGKIKEELLKIRKALMDDDINITLRPETTGKDSQFGTIGELVSLSQEIPGILPCVDFSHIHARMRGRYNTYDEFTEILSRIEEIGNGALKDMHIHVSGIEYTLKGERRHLNLKQSDFNYVDLMKALKDFRAEGLVICESPNLEDDALLLKETYHGL